MQVVLNFLARNDVRQSWYCWKLNSKHKKNRVNTAKPNNISAISRAFTANMVRNKLLACLTDNLCAKRYKENEHKVRMLGVRDGL